VQDEETVHFNKDLESMHVPDVSFHLASSECNRFCPNLLIPLLHHDRGSG